MVRLVFKENDNCYQRGHIDYKLQNYYGKMLKEVARISPGRVHRIIICLTDTKCLRGDWPSLFVGTRRVSTVIKAKAHFTGTEFKSQRLHHIYSRVAKR